MALLWVLVFEEEAKVPQALVGRVGREISSCMGSGEAWGSWARVVARAEQH